MKKVLITAGILTALIQVGGNIMIFLSLLSVTLYVLTSITMKKLCATLG